MIAAVDRAQPWRNRHGRAAVARERFNQAMRSLAKSAIGGARGDAARGRRCGWYAIDKIGDPVAATARDDDRGGTRRRVTFVQMGL